MPTFDELVSADRASTHPGKRSIDDRFAEKVKRTPTCWLWTGSTGRDGYGQLMVGAGWHRRPLSAPRLALLLDGRPVPRGLVTRHLCHNPACVRPSHLTFGTQAENVADSVRDQRYGRGEASHSARLRAQEVIAIRRSPDAPLAALAETYGVSVGAIWNARHGKTWRHLPLAPAVSR